MILFFFSFHLLWFFSLSLPYPCLSNDDNSNNNNITTTHYSPLTTYYLHSLNIVITPKIIP